MNALDDETAKADRYQAWLLAVKPDSGDESYAIETFEDYIRFTEISNFAQKGEVLRDVVRTFPNHTFFRHGTGELMLTRILTAYTLSRPSVGYCQGMNFVCAIVILGRLSAQYPMITSLARSDIDGIDSIDTPKVDPDSSYCRRVEYDVYVFLLYLSAKGSKIAMHSLWQSGQSQVKLRAYQLDKTLKWITPKLYHHFREIQLTPEVFVAQWFVTLFSYTVPIQLTMMIWDYIFVDGWPAIFQLALSLLKTLESHLLERDLEGISSVMRNWRLTERIDVPDLRYEGIIERAHLMPVNEEVLQKLQESFALEMISLSEATLKIPVKESSRTSSFSSLFMQAPTPAATAPERWLERYGDKLTADVAEDMLKIRDDLSNMEARTDEDKIQIQSKIVLACEACREAQEQLDEAKERHQVCIDTVFEITDELEASCASALLVAKAAAMDVEGDTADADDDEIFHLSTTLDELSDHIPPVAATSNSSDIVDTDGDQSPYFCRTTAMGKDISRSASVDSACGVVESGQGSPEKTNISSSITAEEESPSFLATQEFDPAESEPKIDTAKRSSIFRRIGSLLKHQKSEKEPKQTTTPNDAASGISQPGSSQSSARSFFSKSIKKWSSVTMAASDNVKEEDPVDVAARAFELERQRRVSKRMKSLTQQSQLYQRKIISLQRALEVAKADLEKAKTELSTAFANEEEAQDRKAMLCEQFQRLVEDASRGRTSKLNFITKHFM